MTIDQPAAHGGAAQPGGASDGAGGFVGAVTEPAIPRYATTRRTDPAGAADELAAALDAPAQALVCVFGDPPLLRADGMAAALHARLGAGMLVGCTTAGELCPEGYAQGTLTAFALPASDYMVATALIENVSRAGPEAAAQAVVDAELRLRRMGAVIDSEHCFALLLVDGTTRAEEELCYALQAALGQVALVGGSAAD
ncbi:MAG TPA: FIST N-terminal domain-containing protein, partial [Planctomycetota bacterium]|nr:FIST N-terminal domain-containing protein [Planctomycetota bacterium]